MATRTKKSAARTLLCATKFWSHCYDGGGGDILAPLFNKPEGCVSTLRRGVRSVVRRQGFTPKQIDAAERFLVKNGFLERRNNRSASSLRVTQKGRRVSCSTTNLAPWTDSQYPGSRLSGR